MLGSDVGRELPDGGSGLVPDNDDAGAVILELVAEFPGGVQRVVFDDDGSQAQHRVEGHNVLGAVREDQSHSVAGGHAQPAQALRCPVNLVPELTVTGAPAEELQCRGRACFCDGPFEHRHERFRGLINLGGNAGLVVLHPRLLVCFRHAHILP